MDKGVSFLGSARFNKALLPVCIVAFACCAFFNVYARIMATLGLEIHDDGTMIGSYQDAGGSELGAHGDQIREGRLLIKRAVREAARRRDAALVFVCKQGSPAYAERSAIMQRQAHAFQAQQQQLAAAAQQQQARKTHPPTPTHCNTQHLHRGIGVARLLLIRR